MAAYDLEEQERIDALKDWWEKWSKLVYAVVGAFLLGMAGVNAWRYYQSTQQADAEVLFRSVEKTAQEVTASKEFKKLSEAANAMAEKFPRTFQATDAQLLAGPQADEKAQVGAEDGAKRDIQKLRHRQMTLRFGGIVFRLRLALGALEIFRRARLRPYPGELIFRVVHRVAFDNRLIGRVGLERRHDVDPVKRREMVEMHDMVMHGVRQHDHVADVLRVDRDFHLQRILHCSH